MVNKNLEELEKYASNEENQKYITELVSNVIVAIRKENSSLEHLENTVKDSEKMKELFNEFKQKDDPNEDKAYEMLIISLEQAVDMIKVFTQLSVNDNSK